ncbi:MAG: hypothetical protein UEK48_08710, partial [Faecalibacterium prausnitzii]|nr:hypothetical protein [Faecalibacterium prausnitzii]
IPRSMGAKICVVGQKVVSFIIIQKFHLTSRLFIRTVSGFPVILWARKKVYRPRSAAWAVFFMLA